MGLPLRVIVVEDSENDALLLIRELKLGGYDTHYVIVDSAAAMHRALDEGRWDLVISDHAMPRFNSRDALELCKRVDPDMPFIIVSGSIGEEFAVQAMKAGAHDYLMKGNLARLVPAVERELREAKTRRDHRRAESAIRHMAFHDALTDLVNRREFEQRLEDALKSTRERGLTHALLYMDLDQFKIVNDTCGHLAGDDLLRQLADLFRHHVRDHDTLARLGGDEFGVLLESCPLERAERIAEDLRKVTRSYRFVWDDKPFTVGMSIGLVPITSDSRSVEALLSAADVACYAAKDMGRNRVHLYADGDADLALRQGNMQWVSRIQTALEEDRFLLYRQSIVPLAHVAPTPPLFEFLLRLREEDGTIIPPGAFLPAAEHYNLMPQIDRWVVRHVFAHLARRIDREPLCGRRCLAFINLSGHSLSDDTFYDFIREELRRSRVPAEILCYEVTETAAIANLGRAVEFIQGIRSEGCRFALDDFGTGLSSFSYLRNIPVDFLKIDGGFILNLLREPMDRAIVTAINQIGHVAGIKTIAEFVENAASMDQLRRIGVDYAQGYGIDTPHPVEE